jgi:O-antigen/teichoic acid export membrane protein
VILGEDWAPAAPIIQVLAISGIFRAMGQVPYWLFLSKGFAGRQFRFYLVAQPLIILGIIAGLPFGAIGVSVGLSVGYGLFWILQMLWASRATETPTLGLIGSALLIVGTVGLPVAAIGLVSSAFIASPLLAMGLGLLGSAVYIAVTLFVVPTYRRQLRVAWKLVRR